MMTIDRGHTGEMVLDGVSMSAEIKAFLAVTHPFKLMGEDALERLAARATTTSYPEAAAILRQDEEATQQLYLIRKGSVKITMRFADGQDVLVDFRGPGESFGFVAQISGETTLATVTAIEETTCHQISRAEVLWMLEKFPFVGEFFMRAHFHKFMENMQEELKRRSLMLVGGNQLLFTTPVGDLVQREPVTVASTASIHDAALLMSRNRISSIVVVDDAGVPLGIATDRDLRDKVIVRGRDVDGPVSSIASRLLVKVDSDEYACEALLKMLRYGIHHLAVVDKGRFVGVVTNHDFMVLQGSSPISVVKEIETQTTVEGLARSIKGMRRVITLLLRGGAKASHVTFINSEIIDRLVRKLIELAERQLGPAPCHYCWVVFGSEGRHEQTFLTDQDNALVYDDPSDERAADAAREYFTKFAKFVNTAMEACGFPRCPGNYMASNPRWRMPLQGWIDKFDEWIETPVAEAILTSEIIFDFRGVAGDMSLAERLRQHVAERAEEHQLFLMHMAHGAIGVRPPLGLFNRFVLEKGSEHRNTVNIKTRCLALIVNIVRLYSLERGVTKTSTVDRIKALSAKHPVMMEFGQELEHAFEFATLLRIHHQMAQIANGAEPDNHINPDALSSYELKGLKEACILIERIQNAISRHYYPGTRM